MKIIITENQLKDKVRQMVKTEGWKNTFEALGLTSRELAKMFFNDDPMEFLNLFNDLKYTKDGLFKDNNNEITIIYNLISKQIDVRYITIWHALETGFKISYKETRNLIRTWLKDIYGLDDIDHIRIIHDFEIEKLLR